MQVPSPRGSQEEENDQITKRSTILSTPNGEVSHLRETWTSSGGSFSGRECIDKMHKLCGSQSCGKDQTEEMKVQLKLGLPVSVSMLLYRCLAIISLSFAGHMGKSHLAGAALATTLSNVTGNSIMVGLVGASSTLCAQVGIFSVARSYPSFA